MQPELSVLLFVGVLTFGLTACGSDANDAETATTSDAGASEHTTGDATRGQAPQTIDEQAIRDRIIGHTVAGKMSSGNAYGEYYAPDGRILAKDYSGQWQIQDDRLCLDYGQGTTCYGVALEGMQAVWYANGKRVGQGTVQPGNPNDFKGKTGS